jgi:hypothetical protein
MRTGRRSAWQTTHSGGSMSCRANSMFLTMLMAMPMWIVRSSLELAVRDNSPEPPAADGTNLWPALLTSIAGALA